MNESNRATVNDSHRGPALHPKADDELSARLAAYDDSISADDPPAAEFAPGLVSLGFIGAALRRRRRFWVTLAVIGLIVGSGYYALKPPTHTATVSVLLVDAPGQNAADQVKTDLALAESLPVAERVISQLGLHQTPSSFLKSYSVIETTPQVITITVKGSTDAGAVRIASAVAGQFLKFRAQYELKQQQVTDDELDSQITQARQQLDAINAQLSQASAQGNSSEISKLKAKQTDATVALGQIRQYATSIKLTTETTTQNMVRSSMVLNPATATKSSLVKEMALYGIGGLVIGLFLGIAIVAIGAIVSDKLRRRDDIAYAAGTPVGLSVGALREDRLPLNSRQQAVARKRDMERFVEYLRHAVPGGSGAPASLAVVAVDDAPTVARAVVDLAAVFAEQGRQVVLADLSAGTAAAHLLGVTRPGIEAADAGGARVVVVVPATEDVAPAGPLPAQGHAPADASLTSACARADLVLSMVTLDPSAGGDHLATWATEAVAAVTAGRSNAMRIQAACDMIRLSGVHLGSVVVIDSDKSDASLGALTPAFQSAAL